MRCKSKIEKHVKLLKPCVKYIFNTLLYLCKDVLWLAYLLTPSGAEKLVCKLLSFSPDFAAENKVFALELEQISFKHFQTTQYNTMQSYPHLTQIVMCNALYSCFRKYVYLFTFCTFYCIGIFQIFLQIYKKNRNSFTKLFTPLIEHCVEGPLAVKASSVQLRWSSFSQILRSLWRTSKGLLE